MKKNYLKNTGYKWLLIMLLLAALTIAVIIYYNRRIKMIQNELKRISLVEWSVGSRQFAVGSRKDETPMTNELMNQ